MPVTAWKDKEGIQREHKTTNLCGAFELFDSEVISLSGDEELQRAIDFAHALQHDAPIAELRQTHPRQE